MQIYNYFICAKCIAEINSHEGNEVSQRLTRDMLNMNSEQDRERESRKDESHGEIICIE